MMLRQVINCVSNFTLECKEHIERLIVTILGSIEQSAHSSKCNSEQ
jgi:hypothetical protein